MGAIYTTILHDVKNKLGISNNEYVLLDTIQKLSVRDGHCRANTEYLASIIGISDRGTRKMMVRLFELGLLKGNKGSWQVTQKWVKMTVFVELSSERQQIPTELSSENSTPKAELSSKKAELSSEITDTIIIDNNSNKETDRENLLALHKALGRTGRLLITDTRRSHLKARLKNFTIDDLKAAAKAIVSNDFMVKGGHNTVDYLLRNDEKVEQWLGKPSQAQTESPF